MSLKICVKDSSLILSVMIQGVRGFNHPRSFLLAIHTNLPFRGPWHPPSKPSGHNAKISQSLNVFNECLTSMAVGIDQGFSTSGSRPHLGSPSDFRGVARLSTNFLKNDGIFKY